MGDQQWVEERFQALSQMSMGRICDRYRQAVGEYPAPEMIRYEIESRVVDMEWAARTRPSGESR